MSKNNRLEILAKRLLSVDKHLIHLLSRRIRLAEEVAMVKLEEDSPLYRPEIEAKRLDQVEDWASQEGVNPEFARSLLYSIIGESCKKQIGLTDSLRLGENVERFNPSYEELRKNLIELTRMWAPLYDQYGSGHQATLASIAFERNLIDSTIEKLPDKDLCVDIGCATGSELHRLSSRFKKLLGLDISPDMIRIGSEKVNKFTNVDLRVHDAETTWPIHDASVSMLIMNNGFCSDIANLNFVLSEAFRVLKPGGYFVVSAYNKESWTQRFYFPWPLGLAAGIDQERNCLEVRVGNRLIPIFAKPYTLKEFQDIMPRHLCLMTHTTYPVLTSILPSEVIEDTNPDGFIGDLERSLESVEHNLGSYIIASGRKS